MSVRLFFCLSFSSCLFSTTSYFFVQLGCAPIRHCLIFLRSVFCGASWHDSSIHIHVFLYDLRTLTPELSTSVAAHLTHYPTTCLLVPASSFRSALSLILQFVDYPELNALVAKLNKKAKVPTRRVLLEKMVAIKKNLESEVALMLDDG